MEKAALVLAFAFATVADVAGVVGIAPEAAGAGTPACGVASGFVEGALAAGKGDEASADG
ncbi:hypothetical protein VSR68_21820 [Paraburkholderia phymatum]